MAITQVQCLLTIWLKMSHFIRSVLDHGKCGTKMKLSPLEVYSCVASVGIFSSCHRNKLRKSTFFVNSVKS